MHGRRLHGGCRSGVRTVGGHDISLPCACGWTPPAEADKVARALACKAYVFGDCGVAKAVIKVLESLFLPTSLLQPADVWLLRLPSHPQPSAVPSRHSMWVRGV